jgi:hypothetical protein
MPRLRRRVRNRRIEYTADQAKTKRAGEMPAYRQAGRRYKFNAKQRKRRPPKGGRYKGKTVADVARN